MNPRVWYSTTLQPFASVRETIAAMVAVVHDALEHGPLLARLSAEMREGPEPEGWRWGYFNAVYHWCASHVVFRPDAARKEQLHRPEWMLAQVRDTGSVQVDCDDLAMLGAALLMKAGLPAGFVVHRQTDLAPWHHVYYAARFLTSQKLWTPADPQSRTPVGLWPDAYERMIFEIPPLKSEAAPTRPRSA